MTIKPRSSQPRTLLVFVNHDQQISFSDRLKINSRLKIYFDLPLFVIIYNSYIHQLATIACEIYGHTYADTFLSCFERIFQFSNMRFRTYTFAVVTTDSDDTVKPHAASILAFETEHLHLEADLIIGTVGINLDRRICWASILNKSFTLMNK